ncbi:hypothetical protein DYB28_001082 [Aphanomyces astaci]|uniref:U2A'/phosphoprotein 32 family A C-terminal domain-containing protein n=1 Tax=Aphanomyces astaci TaxID=112090 RepID=A0A9X8HAR2_APHAT|nr:hypothetical protein DYB28_001082 [Aphanomyces astaci]
MQRGKIRQQHKAIADVAEKPKIKKLTKEKVADEHNSATDHLDLAHRGIETIETNAFDAATALKRLDLSANKLTRIAFTHNMSLTQLKITSNVLVDAGIVDLSFCKQLVTLDLSDNKLARLPGASLRHCTGLRALVLTKNAMTSLEWVPSLPGLTSLIVSHNRITEISAKSIGKLKGLTKLQLYCTPSSILSMSLNQYGHYNYRSSHNKLTELPDLSVLEQLTEVRASNNQLTALPASINHNVNLKIVDVCHNHIDTFDGLDQWTSLAQLKQLNLRGNPICGQNSTLPMELVDSAKEKEEDATVSQVDLAERKALDKKNKLYNFKMKRLFPALIVRDGQRIQDKRTHGNDEYFCVLRYVAPPPEPKAPKPVKKDATASAAAETTDGQKTKKKRRKESKDEAVEDEGRRHAGETLDDVKKAAKKAKKDKKRAAQDETATDIIQTAKRSKKDREAAESKGSKDGKVSVVAAKELATTTPKDMKHGDKSEGVEGNDEHGEKPAKKEKGRKKKEKYAKDSGVLSVVHVKKSAKSAAVSSTATAPVDFTQLDTSGGVGMGGESSWD